MARGPRSRARAAAGVRATVLHPGVLPDRRLRRADRPRNRGDRLAAPRPLAYILHLVHADHSSLALLTSQTEATTLLGRLRVVGVPMLKAERISCSGPKLSDAQTRNFEAIKRTGSRPLGEEGIGEASVPPAYRRDFANIGLDGYVWRLWGCNVFDCCLGCGRMETYGWVACGYVPGRRAPRFNRNGGIAQTSRAT